MLQQLWDWGEGGEGGRTVSVAASSDSFLPTSLLVHSSILASPPDLVEATPGTTRGILVDLAALVGLFCLLSDA